MGRSHSLWIATTSIVGSFLVYGADLACGGVGRGVAQVPTASVSTTASPPASATSATCACPSGPPPTTTATFTTSGDEKMTLDPTDATADLEVRFVRGAGGKKLAEISGVVRVFRLDSPSERPTTLAIRARVPEVGGAPGAKDVDAYVTTWTSTGAATARAYATVQKSALTTTVTDDAVVIEGSLVLKDVPTGRTVTIDKLAIRKSGASLLPPRTGAFKAP